MESNPSPPRRRSRRIVWIVAALIAAMGLWFVLQASDDDVGVTITAGAEQPSMEELIAAGRQPYIDHCAACHRADGKGFPNDIPALDGSKVVRGSKSKHIAVVISGRPGTAMPAFQAQLTDYQIAAILTYERNAWFYKTFNSVTPAEVQAIRAKLANAPVTVGK